MLSRSTVASALLRRRSPRLALSHAGHASLWSSSRFASGASFPRIASSLRSFSSKKAPRGGQHTNFCAGSSLLAVQSSHWAYQRRWQSSNGLGYGTIPSDIDSPRGTEKPSEASLLREERRRQQGGHAGSAEEANEEAVSTHVSGYNPWEVLGLKAGASTHTIRLRYHELMKEVHPDMAPDGAGDIPRLNQINKAYELITKSPTLDRRYRNLVSDTQYFYYKFLPEWMARNVDEMPRYWSWVKWRTPGGFHIFLLLIGFYVLGRFYAAFPLLTSVFLISVAVDILLHTMIAPASLCMLFLYSIMAYRSYDMAWLTSPKGFLRRELGY